MSSQKGNTSRTRAQKYKNRRVFKNDLYDKTPQNKFINSLNISNVCERCKNIMEWKIKYKKYKTLTAPRKCTKCEQKSIKHAYHILCRECASKAQVCPACGKEKEIVDTALPQDEQFKLDKELQQMIKALPERKRRTFLRYIANKEKAAAKEDDPVSKEYSKSDLLAKLESLKVQTDSDDEDDFDDDFDEDNGDDCSDDDSGSCKS